MISLSHDSMVNLRSKYSSSKKSSLIWLSSLQFSIHNSFRDVQYYSPLGRAPNLQPQIFNGHLKSQKSPGIEIKSGQCHRAVLCCTPGMDATSLQFHILKNWRDVKPWNSLDKYFNLSQYLISKFYKRWKMKYRNTFQLVKLVNGQIFKTRKYYSNLNNFFTWYHPLFKTILNRVNSFSVGNCMATMPLLL